MYVCMFIYQQPNIIKKTAEKVTTALAMPSRRQQKHYNGCRYYM